MNDIAKHINFFIVSKSYLWYLLLLLPGVALPWFDGGLGLGVGLAGCWFLCAGRYIALLIEHEWRPSAPGS